LPVESDAVSEGDLLDEEEAGVPSAKPKLNGKKSKGGFYTIFYRKKLSGKIDSKNFEKTFETD